MAKTTTTTTCRVSKGEKRYVVEAAKREGVTQTEIVRRAIANLDKAKRGQG